MPHLTIDIAFFRRIRVFGQGATRPRRYSTVEARRRYYAEYRARRFAGIGDKPAKLEEGTS